MASIVKGTATSVKAGRSVTGVFVGREEFDSHKSFILVFTSAVMLFVVVTFLMEISSMHRNYEQDKSLALQNNQLNKDYFDKVLLLQNQVNELKNQYDVLKARNSYLK